MIIQKFRCATKVLQLHFFALQKENDNGRISRLWKGTREPFTFQKDPISKKDREVFYPYLFQNTIDNEEKLPLHGVLRSAMARQSRSLATWKTTKSLAI
jgi:hypothetical protein